MTENETEEARLRVEFEKIFKDDVNFQSESENTKSWMFKAFAAGVELAVNDEFEDDTTP